MALLVRRNDLFWTGLEGSLDCLPGLHQALARGAIVDEPALAPVTGAFRQTSLAIYDAYADHIVGF